MALGPHVILSTPSGTDWLRRCGIMKSIDNRQALHEATTAHTRIFRHYFANQDINRNGANVAAEVLASLGDAPANFIELYNEVAVKLGAGLERHVALTAEAVAYLKVTRPDLTIVGYSIPTGNIEQADWDYLRAHQFGDVQVIGWHSYWGNSGFTLDNALRYRQFWRPGDPTLVLSECGHDKVEGGKGGWKLDGISAEQYASELTAYDLMIAQDHYVLGATPFTSGPTPDWANFDMDPIAPLLPSGGNVPVGVKMTPGIDVSNNNGVIDWSLAARCGIGFAVIKASEGTGFTDPDFATNWASAQANGLVRGAYCFGRPSGGSGHADANYFLSVVKDIQVGDFLALDLEDDRVSPNADLAAYALDWFATVEAAVGFKPMLYSGAYYLQPHNLENNAQISQHGLWLASWQTTVPPVPPGWGFTAMWQYSANGTLPGITGAVDLDLFQGSIDLLRKYGKLV